MMTTDVLTEIASAVASAASLLQTADNNIQKAALQKEPRGAMERVTETVVRARMSIEEAAFAIEEAILLFKHESMKDHEVKYEASERKIVGDLNTKFENYQVKEE